VSNSRTQPDRRIAPRFGANIDGRLKCSRGSRRSIEITDISVGGCAVSLGPLDVAQGRGYAIKFGGLETLGAELRWIADGDAGLAFERPLHPAVVDHIVRMNAPHSPEDADREPETAAG